MQRVDLYASVGEQKAKAAGRATEGANTKNTKVTSKGASLTTGYSPSPRPACPERGPARGGAAGRTRTCSSPSRCTPAVFMSSWRQTARRNERDTRRNREKTVSDRERPYNKPMQTRSTTAAAPTRQRTRRVLRKWVIKTNAVHPKKNAAPC